MPAPVVRQSLVQSASGSYLDTALASANPSPRTLYCKVPTAAELNAMSGITASKLRRLATSRVTAVQVAAYATALEAHRQKGEINTLYRVTHFLSQLAHECMHFARMVESFAYKPASAVATFSKIGSEEDAAALLAEDTTGEAFANFVYATSNGNSEPGDGYRFRGRGFIQLTGRANYKAFSAAINLAGVDLVVTPDRAAEADIAARIAVAYWKQRGINTAADRDDTAAVTRLINGKALKGLAERRQLLDVARNAFFPRP